MILRLIQNCFAKTKYGTNINLEIYEITIHHHLAPPAFFCLKTKGLSVNGQFCIKSE